MNPFTDNDQGQPAPDMLMQASASGFNPAEYRYRIERFELGSQDNEDQESALEALLDRSLTPEVFVLERKDSISATTGVYTCIVIYLERRPQVQGETHA